MKRLGRTGIAAMAVLLLLVPVGCTDGQDHLDKAREAHKTGQLAEATKEYTAAIDSGDLAPDALADAHRSRGDIYRKVGPDTAALADYTNAIKLDPADASAYRHRGVIYTRTGQFAQALADCTRVIELAGTDPEAWHARGLLHVWMGDPAKANADFARADALRP